MENNYNISINELPSKTWHWLHMNNTVISWNSEISPCQVTMDADANVNMDASTEKMETSSCQIAMDADANVNIGASAEEIAAWSQIETGAGKEADAIFLNENTKVCYFRAEKTTGKTTLRVTIDGEEKAFAAGVFYIKAEENAEITVIETFVKESKDAGNLAFRTVIDAAKNSRVNLVQVFMQSEEQTLINDVGCVCEENAQFDGLQIFLGEGNLYHGIRADLKGMHSGVQEKIGYFGQKNQMLDINLIVNHYGKKSNSEIQVEGILKDAAEKTFRGTIDFKKGASESTGAETEQVLLLGDDVINKTIPVILCAEEDVEGSHGATLGELDEETLFYFASRGIGKETAEDMMTRGKLEMFNRYIGDAATQKLAEQQLEKVLGNDERELLQ